MKGLEVGETERKGKGVFPLRSFRKGELILRSKRGRRVGEDGIKRLSKEYRSHLTQVEKGVFEVQSSPEKYINHSCDPNVISRGRGIFAFRKIRRGEELTADYRIGALNEGWRLRCKCGSKDCSKTVVGDFFTLSKEMQELYLPCAPPFVRKDYKKVVSIILLTGQ